ncbi:MAG: FadR family transcriptional regulator [Dehalobacter sp.]|nr:FadR family transcriptional regulator [Dehalobacter sp.]
MNLPFKPLHVSSLKEACVSRLESLILSGELKPGERLPSEREFAAALGVSRPVLHEALVDLEAKGLVSILPRRGVQVSDFRKSGSVAMLSTLLAFNQGALDPQFIKSLFAMRVLMETETARLAALHASPEQIAELDALLQRERDCSRANVAGLTEVDFDFHLALAIISGNLIYPLILNSFKNVYTHLTGSFFQLVQGSEVLRDVHAYHVRLVEAVRNRQPDLAAEIMSNLLRHGETLLKGSMPEFPGR